MQVFCASILKLIFILSSVKDDDFATYFMFNFVL